MKKLAAVIVLVIFIAIGLSLLANQRRVTAETSDATYVSEKKCRGCHNQAFKQQAETPHARSFKSLKDAGEADNPKCLTCHTTAYGKTGGFVDAKSTPDLAGVMCQACHGPGSAHVAEGLSKEQRRETIVQKPGENCTKCHRIHLPHPDIGKKAIPSLEEKIDRIKSRIKKIKD